MKPVGPKNALPQVLDDKPLMMLNWRLLGIRYIKQLVTISPANVTTANGTALCFELWDMILGLALADTKESFCFVQGISLRTSSMGSILHCGLVNLVGDRFFGDLDCAKAVYEYEEMIKKPDRDGPPSQPDKSYRKTFEILLTSAHESIPVDLACLFSNITVPDVISYMEGGACRLCNSTRFLCPGCGGRADSFDVFMGCGVELVCPLCIGIDFSREHKEILQKYYWDDPSDEEQKSIDDWLQQRFDELNY